MATSILSIAAMTVASAPGTSSTITLAAAAPGFMSFADAGAYDGATVLYMIEDGGNWETGIGTYDANANTIERVTVENSSDGGNRIDASDACLVSLTYIKGTGLPGGGGTDPAIEARLTQAENDIANLQGRMTAVEGEASGNTTEIGLLSGRVTAVEGVSSQNTGDISALDGRVTANEGDIASLDGRIGTAENTIDVHTGEIGANAANIATNTGNIASLGGRVTANEGDILTNIGAISALDGRLTTAEGDIDAAQTAITNANNAITALDGRLITAEAALAAIQPLLTNTVIADNYASLNLAVAAMTEGSVLLLTDGKTYTLDTNPLDDWPDVFAVRTLLGGEATIDGSNLPNFSPNGIVAPWGSLDATTQANIQSALRAGAPIYVTSITYNNGTATATTLLPHGRTTGDRVFIYQYSSMTNSNAAYLTQADSDEGMGFTIPVQITVTGANTFTYTPPEYPGPASVALNGGGSGGYKVNETVTLSGGTGDPTILRITGVSGGAITSFSILRYGSYSVTPTNPVSCTGGSGTGATFNLTFGYSTTAYMRPNDRWVELQAADAAKYAEGDMLLLQSSEQYSGYNGGVVLYDGEHNEVALVEGNGLWLREPVEYDYVTTPLVTKVNPKQFSIQSVHIKGRGPDLSPDYRNFSVTSYGGWGGWGYSVNDVLTVEGDYTTPAQIRVDTVDGNGTVLTFTVLSYGNYTSRPETPSFVTGGTGYGLLLGSNWYNYGYGDRGFVPRYVRNMHMKNVRISDCENCGWLVLNGLNCVIEYPTVYAAKINEGGRITGFIETTYCGAVGNACRNIRIKGHKSVGGRHGWTETCLSGWGPGRATNILLDEPECLHTWSTNIDTHDMYKNLIIRSPVVKHGGGISVRNGSAIITDVIAHNVYVAVLVSALLKDVFVNVRDAVNCEYAIVRLTPSASAPEPENCAVVGVRSRGSGLFGVRAELRSDMTWYGLIIHDIDCRDIYYYPVYLTDYSGNTNYEFNNCSVTKIRSHGSGHLCYVKNAVECDFEDFRGYECQASAQLLVLTGTSDANRIFNMRGKTVTPADMSFSIPAGSTRNFTDLLRYETLTISGGAITKQFANVKMAIVDTEGGASTDDLVTINGHLAGEDVFIRQQNDARNIVLKNGTGNLDIGADKTLDTISDIAHLVHNGTDLVMPNQ